MGCLSKGALKPTNSGEKCLVGCTDEKKLNCGVDCVMPIDEQILSPFVKVTFKDDKNFVLTVGNESYRNSQKDNNSAVIVDFEYGTSDGAGVRFTVHDTVGTPLETFARKLNKSLAQTSDDYIMDIEFGWIGMDCNRNVSQIKSKKVTFLPLSFEMSYNDGGKIKYTIEGSDLFWAMLQTRIDRVYGDDNNKLPLKEAIRKMFKEEPQPVISSVNFYRQTKDGPKEWEFMANEKKEIKDKWPGNNRSKIEAALAWLRPYLTDNKRGIFYTWDTSLSEPGIIFWEAPLGADGVDKNCVAQYIINAGGCSPVISFSPKVKMVYGKAHNMTGGAIGAGGVKAHKIEPLEGIDAAEGAGVAYAGASASKDHVQEAYSRSSATTATVQKNEGEHRRWNFPFGESVQADLVIQGDPRNAYVSIPDYAGKTLSIIALNPFHISEQVVPTKPGDPSSASCSQWLATPPCNPIFTSNMWFIKKIHHSIKAGSYITTINLMLPVGTDVTKAATDPQNPLQEE